MTSVSKRIVAHARSVPEATPICAGALLHIGNRTAVDQALSRLARSGRLMRICQGIYISELAEARATMPHWMAEPMSHLVATPHQEPQS